jgi:hypothetical protein
VHATLEIGAPSCGGGSLLFLKVKISRYVDPAFPGWVECSFVDAIGHEHLFVEKVPAVTEAGLDETSHFPQPGFVGCVVIGRTTRADGRERVLIDTERPWGVETTVGRSQFEVFPEQVCEHPREDGGA